MVGELLGHFRVLEQIGAGGMGVVYRARDERLDRDVALKILPTSFPPGAPARRRFRQEALALSRLNHPNIATVHDFVTEGGLDILVMEFIPGVTLSDRVLAGPLSEAEIIDVGAQLAAGLQAAHDQGVIHRDVKPGNLRLTPDGRLKILDFGVARLMGGDRADSDRLTGSDAVRPPGTLPYLAPEQLCGRPPTVASDIYAAGVTLYELATGRPPFSGTQAVLIDEILNRDPQPPSALSRGITHRLDDVVLKAMAKQPDRRHQTARELLADLTAPAPPPPPPPARRIPHLSRRSAIAGTLALVVTTLLGWIVASRVTSSFEPRGRVVMADFDNRTGDPVFDRTVHEALSVALQQSAYLNLMTRDQQYEALRRMKRPDVTRIGEDAGLEICRREGVPVLMAGAIFQSGPRLQIAVRAIEAETGRVMFTNMIDVEQREHLLGRLDVLARQIRQRLGESLARIEQTSDPLEKVTTSSLEALRRYSEADDAVARGELERAAELLEGALLLDADFAMAHRVLARVYASAGKREQAVEHLARAYDLRQTVTPRERHFIEGSHASIRERYDEAAAAFSRLATLYPDDPDAHYELALARYASGDLKGARDALATELRLRPASSRASELLVFVLARDNLPDEALAAASRAATAAGGTPRLRWGSGLARFALGQLVDARRDFSALESDGAAYATIGQLYLTRVDLYEGRLASAIEQLTADIERDRAASRPSAELLRRYLRGRIQLLLGRPAEAQADARAIEAARPPEVQVANIAEAALLYAWSGDRSGARRLLERVQAVAGESPSAFGTSCVHLLDGEVALLEGRLDAAVSAFERGAAVYPGYLATMGLARAHARRGDRVRSAESWQRVLAAKGLILQDGFPPDWVTAHYEAARVLAALGRTDAARRHLTAFTTIWQSTDNPGVRREAEALLGSLQ